jgi:hypothetical protein
MKKLTFLIVNIFFSLNFLHAQTTLQYSVHALKAGIDNPMSYCKYSDPGLAGDNQTWDFSQLQFEQPFTGFVKKSVFSNFQSVFPQSNTVLAEFNSLFYLNVTKDQVVQNGYISSDGSTKITYSVPFVKMKFPFAFGDIYSGSVIGTFEGPGNSTGNITGSYTVEADGYGTLILPNNSVFNDVLRVNTHKFYDNQLTNSVQHVDIVTVRWYNSIHRYPLLVLTKYTTSGDGIESINYQAAYNSDAIRSTLDLSSLSLSDDNLTLFPNPVTTSLNMTFDSPVSGNMNIQIYHADGKQIKSFNQDYILGTHNYNLSKEISGLLPGPYILVVNFGGSRIAKDFTLIK